MKGARDPELDRLEAKAFSAHIAYIKAYRRVRDYRVSKAGIAVGDIVIKGGVEYKITSIDASFERPWVKGSPRRKSGEWGTAIRSLYGDWKKA
jgi:hypothetical protein